MSNETIGTAVQKGETVYVYNERGTQIFTRGGQLVGFTSSTVSVKIGSSIHVYNANGTQISTHSC